jgi:hypothetical protein
LDKPAVYRITVEGVVPESWIDRLGGLGIVSVTSAATTLEGRLPDQAALNGILDTLYNLRLPLLEVSCLLQGGPDESVSHPENFTQEK